MESETVEGGQDEAEALEGESERGTPIAEITAEARSRRAAYYSIQRVGRTPSPVPAPSARRPSRSSRPASACSKKRFCSSVSPRMTFSMLR